MQIQTTITNWFQTDEAYTFFASMPELFTPFKVEIGDGKCNMENGIRHRAVCVGYITKEKNPIKQFLTRRAIIIGGPEIAAGCTQEEVQLLMENVIKQLNGKCNMENGKCSCSPIYIEIRNFNDYTTYRRAFEKAGFTYLLHNNFHVSTETFKDVKCNMEDGRCIDYSNVIPGLMGKGRIRDIKTSFRDGAVVIDNPTIEQVREYYVILKHLYTTRVKTPLFPLSFFEQLYANKAGRFILVGLKDGKCNMENGKCNMEIIGGTVCVEQEGKCLYEWFVAGRDGEWKSIFPSSVATYAGIRYAAEHGIPRFDMMGAGTPNEAYGVRDFKARFGGDLVEHGRFICINKKLLFALGKLGVKLLKHLK